MAGKTKEKKRVRAYFGKRHIEVEDSKVIDRVYYDPETLTLDAVFKKGARYRYRKVPTKVFAQFVLAPSLGRFFNKNIRTSYTTELINA